MNTGQKGDFSEVKVLAELLRQGRRVAIPYGNSQGYDLLVLSCNGTWVSIQVKTAYRRGVRRNHVYVDTIRGSSLHKKRGYGEGSFDFLIAVIPDEDKYWVIPFSEMRNRRCITIPDKRESGFNLF